MNSLFRKSCIVLAFLICAVRSFAQTETFTTGSFIINMGATNPNTIANGLKPYGLIYDLIRNYQCPVKWIISQTKLKDGVDFTYNGTGYKGGTFIIPKEFRTASVNARIAYWQGKGVVGITTVSPLTLDVYRTLLSVPKWTLDKANGKIAEQFLLNAGINNTDFPNAYNWKDPSTLGPCDDFFVMPHADPTWATHGNLYNWNRTYLGTIWADCHAVSVLENMFNPSNPSQRTNFLTTNGLTLFKNHSNGSPPYIHRLPGDPASQYLGPTDAATTNGSEEIYMPDASKSSLWRSTTKIIAYDPTQKDVSNVASDLSNAAAITVTGRGFGNPAYGWVTYFAGHNQNNNSAGSVAAQRSFFAFSFFQVIEKTPVLPTIPPISASQPLPNGTVINLSIGNATSPVPGVTFTYQWISSCGGTFSSSGSGQNVTWTSPAVGSLTNCIISCIVTDNCGRSTIGSIPVKLAGPAQAPTPQADSSIVTPSCGVGLSITRNVLTNDSDPDGRPLTLTSVTGAVNGTVSFTASGDVTYTPNPGFFGAETLTYQVCNNASLCTGSTYKITVGDPSLVPVVANDSYSIIEDHKTRFNVLANDGSGLTVMGIPVYPSHGKVSINIDNTISYLPDADFSGTDNFTYKITNASGYTNQATVTITITTDGCTGGTYETVAAYNATSTYNPGADTYVDKGNTTKNNGSCTVVSVDGQTNNMLHGLLKFDLTTTPLTGSIIPGNASVTSSSLAMVATSVVNNSSFAIDIHRVTTAWNQGTLCGGTNSAGSNGATWNNNNFASTWGTAGGDYSATIEGTTNVSVVGTYTWGLTSLVQNWFATPANNLGLLMRFNTEGTPNNGKNFGSVEDPTAANRPILTVNYYVPHVCSLIPTRAPMAMPDSATTANGVAVIIPVAANDYHPSAGTKSYSIITAPVSGNAVINNSTGDITYTPNTTFNGVRSMTYEVLNTATGLRDTAFVYVNITNGKIKANADAPAGDSSSVTQTINVKANDNDPDFGTPDNSYTVTITTAPKNGSASVDGSGNVLYTPFPGYTGKDTLYYSVTEPAPSCGSPFSDTAMVVLTVFNRPPAANDDVKNTLPCQAITFNIINNDTDPENGVLSVTNISSLNPFGAGTVTNNNDGTVTYTPATGFTGTATFTYTVTDNGVAPLSSAPATVTLNVATVINHPPVAMNDYADTTVMDELSFTNVLDNDYDPDNNALTNPTIIVSPLHGTATVLPNGLISYVPNPGFFGADTLTYQVCDIVSNPSNCVQTPTACTTAKLFLYVQVPNTTTAVNDENSTWVNTPVNGNVMNNDFDLEGDAQIFSGFRDTSGFINFSGTFTVSGTDAAGNPVSNAGTVTILSGGNYLYTPAHDFTGVMTVKYFIVDNQNIPASDSAFLKITVNSFPKITNSLIANNDEYITYGSPVSGNILTNDLDPQGDLFSTTSYKYDSDGDGTTDGNGTIGSSVILGGVTTAGLPVANAGTLVLNANGTFTFTPVADFHGYVFIVYTICDNGTPQACASSVLKITVLPDINNLQNDPPVAGDDFSVTTINTPVNGNFIANDYDPNGDSLSLNGTTLNPSGAHTPVGSPVVTAMGGTVQYYTDGTYTYTPAPGYAGPDSTGYQVCDVTNIAPHPLCTNAFLHFLVSAFNSILPVNDINNTWTNIPVSGNVLTNDQDPEDNTLTLTGIRDASNVLQTIAGGGTTVSVTGKDKSGNAVPNAGSLTIHPDGSYTYTPASNFTGIAFTKYSVCDNGFLPVCNEVNITITVNDVPQTNGTIGTNITIANNDAKGTIVNIPVSGNVISNDKDPEGNVQGFVSFLDQNGSGSSITTGTSVSGLDTAGNVVIGAGVITFSNNGNYTFTPTAGFIGTVTIPYRVCDNGNPVACDEANLTIDIVPNINHSANKRPVGTDDLNTVNNLLNPGSKATGNVLTNDFDPGSGNGVNGTTLTVQNAGTFSTAHGSITIAADGSYTYTPDITYTGPDQFIYTLCDNGTPALCTRATLYFLDIEESVTLSIDLLHLMGQSLKGSNVLTWTTSNEINSNHFEIETKTDTSNFIKIGVVQAKGNTTTQSTYSFTHYYPQAAVNYYRLKMVDNNNKFKYSNIIALRTDGTTVTIDRIYPNPFKDKIEASVVLTSTQLLTTNLYDANGRIIRSQQVQSVRGLNTVTLDNLNNISAGIYFLEIKSNEGVVKAKLFKIH